MKRARKHRKRHMLPGPAGVRQQRLEMLHQKSSSKKSPKEGEDYAYDDDDDDDEHDGVHGNGAKYKKQRHMHTYMHTTQRATHVQIWDAMCLSLDRILPSHLNLDRDSNNDSCSGSGSGSGSGSDSKWLRQALGEEFTLLSDLEYRPSLHIRQIVVQVDAIHPHGHLDYTVDLVDESSSSVRTNSSTCIRDKSHAEGFPVHKYRVMRRNVGGGSASASANSSSGNKTSSSATSTSTAHTSQGHNNHDRQTESEICTAGIDTNDESAMCNGNDEAMQDFAMAPVQQRPYPDVNNLNTNPLVTASAVHVHVHGTEWRTVCETTQSDETECIDSSNKGLERGQNYIYRIQAWSAAGSSHWAVLDPSKEWMEYGCDGTGTTSSSSSLINENGTLVVEEHTTDSMNVNGGEANSSNSRTNQNRSLDTEHGHGHGKKERERPVKSIRPMALFVVLRRVIDVMTFIVKFVSAVLTMGSLLLRFQRVGPTSTSMAGREMDQPFFPWLLEQINDTSKKYVGFRIIPESLILYCEEDAVRQDTVVKRVGLNGYRQAPSMRDIKTTERATSTGSEPQFRSTPQIPLSMSRSRSVPDESEDPTRTSRVDQQQRRDAQNLKEFTQDIQTPPQPTKKNKSKRDREQRSGPFKMVRSHKSRKETKSILDRPLQHQQLSVLPTPSSSSSEDLDDIVNQNVDGFLTPTVSTTPVTVITSKSKTRKFPFRRKHKDDNRDRETHPHSSSLPDPHAISQAPNNILSPQAMGDYYGYQQQQQQQSHSYCSPSIDVGNHTLCNCCGKKFKFPKRCRHHCSRCGNTFCHKHGRCTHSNIVSCKVPGDCVCDRCLQGK